jgi:hypothetical protein
MAQEIEVISEEKKLATVTPMTLIERAQAANASIDQMQQLFDLQLRWEENEARKAYNRAFASFKAESVQIIKNITVTDGPLKGKKYADLFAAVNAITPALSKHGLSHTWRLTRDEEKWLEVTCTIRHELGYSESVSMGGPPDTGGAKNAIQARASSKSYLERYTLLGITGLASCDQDNDGAGSGKKEPTVELITENQVMDILGLIKEVKADEAALCTYFKVADVANIPAEKFGKVVAMLEAKRGK